jgi:hypothetical protein
VFVPPVHRISAGSKRFALPAPIRRIAGVLTVNRVRSNRKNGLPLTAARLFRACLLLIRLCCGNKRVFWYGVKLARLPPREVVFTL